MISEMIRDTLTYAVEPQAIRWSATAHLLAGGMVPSAIVSCFCIFSIIFERTSSNVRRYIYSQWTGNEKLK